MNVEIIRVLGKECQLVTQKAEAVVLEFHYLVDFLLKVFFITWWLLAQPVISLLLCCPLVVYTFLTGRAT